MAFDLHARGAPKCFHLSCLEHVSSNMLIFVFVVHNFIHVFTPLKNMNKMEKSKGIDVMFC